MRKWKDIFVDNTVAKNFCNPLDPEYKEFIRWLFFQGSLVVSNKILAEYNRTCSGSRSPSNILAVIAAQTRRGRLRKFQNAELATIQFSKGQVRKLRRNAEDYLHIKLVILSRRRLALTNDQNFAWDVNNFPGVAGRASNRPEKLPYRIP
ncbi:MAG TPA: hypothetical protein VIW07_04620 [Candidatus Udaeobacter sp.]|jgi:hypothetical protein